MKRFAIDIDSVIAATGRGLDRELSRRLGRPINQSSRPYYFIEDTLHADVAALDTAKLLMKDPEFYLGLDPIPGARDSVSLISQRYWTCYLTARGEDEYDATSTWLHNLRFPRLDIVLSHDKGKTAEDLGITHAVEDAPHHALRLADNGVVVYLMDYSYNRDIDHPSIIRVRNWRDVISNVEASNRD